MKPQSHCVKQTTNSDYIESSGVICPNSRFYGGLADHRQKDFPITGKGIVISCIRIVRVDLIS